MSSTVFNAHSHARLAPRERPAGLSLRRRSSDHPLVMYTIIAGIAFASMAFVQTPGPRFVSFGAPARIGEDVRTTTRIAGAPVRETDIVCRGQSWTDETEICMRAMAADSGTKQARVVRRIAEPRPDATTPNMF